MRPALFFIVTLVLSAALPCASGEPTREQFSEAFDTLWKEMDRHYAYFQLKKVDWNKAKQTHRDKAINAGSTDAFHEAVRGMLLSIGDYRITTEVPNRRQAVAAASYRQNWSKEVVAASIIDPVRCGRFATVAKIKEHGFGYLRLDHTAIGDEKSVQQTIDAIRKHADAPGFVIDLRQVNGGDEALFKLIAQAFCDKETVYAKTKNRSGPKHSDFGKPEDFVLKAGEMPYTKPIVCLIGQYQRGPGEDFALMFKALPHATLVGATTRGSNGRTIPLDLPHVAIKVAFARGIGMDAKGQIIEDTGVKPHIEVSDQSGSHTPKSDPTLEKGFSVLKEKIARK